MKKRRKQSLLFGIILLIFGLGLGYAYLTTNLSIEGITDIDSNTWNVYWDNVQVMNGSVTGNQVTQAPTIDTDKTTVSFHVRLSQPGDYYEFTIDAVNDGSIDAMIETIHKTINNSTTVPNYLTYTVTYDDDLEVTNNQLLASGDMETYKVRIEYRSDIDASQLPDAAQTLNLKFDVEYVQAEGATPVRTSIYYNEHTPAFTIGNTVPTAITSYDNYQDLMADSGYPVFLKHIVANNNITRSYVGFVRNDNVYYLRGGGATYNESEAIWNNDSIYYEENKAILLNAFGSEICTEDTIVYYCDDSVSSFSAYALKDGGVVASDSNWECSVNSDGYSRCGGEGIG